MTLADGKDACSIARIITEMLGSLDRLRELHCDLYAILVDDYGDELKEVIRASEDVEKKVLECRVRSRTLGSRENLPKSNNPGRKSNCGVKRCWGWLTTRKHLSDSQLMDLNKNLGILDLEGNEILEKNTKLAKCVSGKDATNRLDDLNEALANAFEKKTDFIKAVRQEIFVS